MTECIFMGYTAWKVKDVDTGRAEFNEINAQKTIDQIAGFSKKMRMPLTTFWKNIETSGGPLFTNGDTTRRPRGEFRTRSSA